MKMSHILQLGFVLLFSFLTSSAFAQSLGDVVVLAQTESFTQATYHIEMDGHEGQVTIRKETGKVSILLENMNGKELGRGSVKNDGNGNPIISLKNVHQGTLPFWVFALNRIIPDESGNGTALSPRKKAYKRCRDRCKEFVSNHAGINVVHVFTGSQVIPAVNLNKVRKAFQAYQRCMWKCMREAKQRYQANQGN